MAGVGPGPSCQNDSRFENSNLSSRNDKNEEIFTESCRVSLFQVVEHVMRFISSSCPCSFEQDSTWHPSSRIISGASILADDFVIFSVLVRQRWPSWSIFNMQSYGSKQAKTSVTNQHNLSVTDSYQSYSLARLKRIIGCQDMANSSFRCVNACICSYVQLLASVYYYAPV